MTSAMPLTAAQLAAELGKHPRTIMRLARTRKIPGSKIGRDWFFDRQEVLAAGRPAPEKPRKTVTLSPADRAVMNLQRLRVKSLLGKAS